MAGATDVGVTDPDHHGVRGWSSRACSPAPAESTAKAEATATAEAAATAGFRWGAGRCGQAGHAVNPPPGSGPAAGGCAFGRLRSSASQAKRPHPWGLDGAIHGANGPACPHRPTSDRFRWLLVGVDLGRHGRSTPCVDSFRFQFEIFDSDGDSSTHGVDLLQIAEICRRRGGSGCGSVRGMDAAAKPPWMGLRRLPQPDPPRHPTDCPLLTLTLTLIRRVQGAALPINPSCDGSSHRATLDPALH